MRSDCEFGDMKGVLGRVNFNSEYTLEVPYLLIVMLLFSSFQTV